MADNSSNRRGFDTQCAECAVPLEKVGHRRKYCAQCRINVRRRRVRLKARRASAGRGPTLHRRKCRRCEAAFGTTGPYNYYCQHCITAAEKSGRSKYQFLSRKAAVIPDSKRCEGCGGNFAPEWVTQIYCGDSCKAKAYRLTPEGLLNCRMRSAIRRGFKGSKNGRTWETLVGYTASDLRSHFERQFTKGMTWADAVEMHIDHIVPLSSFRFESADDPDFGAAWALSNLRLLWARDNISKGAKRLHLL